MLNAHAETKTENSALQPGASRKIGDKRPIICGNHGIKGHYEAFSRNCK